MKRTVEIEDSMQELIDSCKEEILDCLKDELRDHLEIPDLDDLFNQSGRVHEIVDSNTPIYNKEIDDLYYLYGNELEDAYNNAGIYDSPPDNYRQVCIYLYLEKQCWDYIRELEDELENFEEEFENIKTDQIRKVLIDEFIETL